MIALMCGTTSPAHLSRWMAIDRAPHGVFDPVAGLESSTPDFRPGLFDSALESDGSQDCLIPAPVGIAQRVVTRGTIGEPQPVTSARALVVTSENCRE